MAEVATEVPTDEQKPEAAEAAEQPKPLGENGEKALRAEREARKAAEKSNAEMAARLKSIEDRDKSEAEKLADRAAAAEKAAADAQTELIRERIARRHKIDDEDLDLLGTGTEEQIEARAQRVAAKNAAAAALTATAPPSEKPVQQLRPGATSTDSSIAPADAYPSDWLTARTKQTRKE